MHSKHIMLTTLAASMVTASAASISVNFSYNGSYNLAPGDTAGVEAVANWNNVASASQTGTTTTNDLIDSDGNTTSTSLTNFNAFWRDGTDTSTPDSTLNSSYTNGIAQGTSTISVSGLSGDFLSNGYTVILYLSGTDGMGVDTAAEFGADVNGGTEQWIRAIRRTPVNGTFSSTTFATEDEAQSSSSESNYIMFTGITGSSFDLNIHGDPDTTAQWGRPAIKGIQIVANPIPEPSSSALIGLAGLAFIMRRRK